MTYVVIRNSVAAVVAFGFGVSQFRKALGNLRRGSAPAERSSAKPWLHIAVMLLSLSFVALAVNLFAAEWQPSAVNFSVMELAFIPIGIAVMAMGAWCVKHGCHQRLQRVSAASAARLPSEWK